MLVRFLSVLFVCLAWAIPAEAQMYNASVSSPVIRITDMPPQDSATVVESKNKAKSEGKSDDAYFSIFDGLKPGETNTGSENETRRLPVVIEETVKPGDDASDKKFEKLSFFATYDKGFAILPYNKKKKPFDMKINGWIQFRHHGFSRDVDSWTDNAGVTRDVRNRGKLWRCSKNAAQTR